LVVLYGDPVDETIRELRRFLTHGDTIVDGGNSNDRQTLQRDEAFILDGIHFAGTSAGIWGGHAVKRE
jgi:6-phosphogluconate dehydrogenase